MKLKIRKTDSFFLSGIFFTVLSCSSPVSIQETDNVTVHIPDYDTKILPILLSYKIVITNEDETRIFYENADSKTFTITLPKEKLTSILIYPVTKPEFFLPAACIYPVDFYSYKDKTEASSLWSSGPAAILLSEMLSSNNETEIIAAKSFNWKKLEETLSKKDSDVFENFDSLKTKKCTTANCLKKDILKTKIIYQDAKISVSYTDTKSVLSQNIKSEEITDETKIYSDYIPLNYFYKEKGWITLQKNSEGKTAFLINGKMTYLTN